MTDSEMWWMIAFAAILIAIGVIILYLPISIAKSRGVENLAAVQVLCLLSLFIPVLWIVALVFALVGSTRPQYQPPAPPTIPTARRATRAELLAAAERLERVE